jgi:hypothetical protein
MQVSFMVGWTRKVYTCDIVEVVLTAGEGAQPDIVASVVDLPALGRANDLSLETLFGKVESGQED